MSKLAVTVLMGGPDAEREVSIQSGSAIAHALEQSNLFSVTSMIIDRITIDDLQKMHADVFFPALHGPYGEGGPLQELLEQNEIPFVGSGSHASRNAMDKVRTKEIAREAGIRTPAWCMLNTDHYCDIDVPLVLKPVDDGSSIDMAICHNEVAVATARKHLHASRDTLLAECYIQGREITVGLINGKPLPIIEIIPPKDILTYDYSAKYERSDTQFILDPTLPQNDCIESSLLLCQTMDIQDIARVDFIINDKGAWFLELNTMPGFTDHSLVPMAARHIDLNMVELCTSLVELAATRLVK